MPGPVFIKAVVVAIVGGIGLIATHYKKRWASTVLLAVAESRGGSVAGNVYTVTLEGVELEVTFFSYKSARQTQYEAKLPPPGTPWFKITPGKVGRVGQLFGAQDIELGDPTVDDQFVVKARDPATVRRLWTRECIRDLNALWKPEIVSDGTTVHLREGRIHTSAQAIVQGIDFLLRLARADAFGLQSLSTLPEAVVHAGGTRDEDNRFGYMEVPGPQPIYVGPIEREQIARTSAWTNTAGDPTAELPAGAAELVNATGEGQLTRTETELRVTWPSIETDERRLIAAIDLLRLLSSGARVGVFR